MRTVLILLLSCLCAGAQGIKPNFFTTNRQNTVDAFMGGLTNLINGNVGPTNFSWNQLTNPPAFQWGSTMLTNLSFGNAGGWNFTNVGGVQVQNIDGETNAVLYGDGTMTAMSYSGYPWGTPAQFGAITVNDANLALANGFGTNILLTSDGWLYAGGFSGNGWGLSNVTARYVSGLLSNSITGNAATAGTATNLAAAGVAPGTLVVGGAGPVDATNTLEIWSATPVARSVWVSTNKTAYTASTLWVGGAGGTKVTSTLLDAQGVYTDQINPHTGGGSLTLSGIASLKVGTTNIVSDAGTSLNAVGLTNGSLTARGTIKGGYLQSGNTVVSGAAQSQMLYYSSVLGGWLGQSAAKAWVFGNADSLTVSNNFFAGGVAVATNGLASYRSNKLALAEIALTAATTYWTNTQNCNVFVLCDGGAGLTDVSINGHGGVFTAGATFTAPLQPGEWIGFTTNDAMGAIHWKPF